jgi:multisubunit Na+/H+ antiporter MnhC subunit
MNSLFLYHLAGLALLGLGFSASVQRRTLVGMLISVELLLNGAGLSIVASARLTPAERRLGQVTSLLDHGPGRRRGDPCPGHHPGRGRRFGNTWKARPVALLRD